MLKNPPYRIQSSILPPGPYSGLLQGYPRCVPVLFFMESLDISPVRLGIPRFAPTTSRIMTFFRQILYSYKVFSALFPSLVLLFSSRVCF